MTLVGVSSGDGERVFAIEFELLLDDAKRFLGNLAFYRPVEDVIGDIGDILWKFVCGNNLLYLRERSLVVRPVESEIESFFFGEGKIVIPNAFVIPEESQARGEKFSPFSGRAHVVDDFRDQCFVFLLGVLFVEDAVLLVPETDAGETVFRSIAALAVVEPDGFVGHSGTKNDIRTVVSRSDSFVHAVSRQAEERIVVTIRTIGVGDSQAPFSIFQIFALKAMKRVLARQEHVSDDVFRLVDIGESSGVFPKVIRNHFSKLERVECEQCVHSAVVLFG